MTTKASTEETTVSTEEEVVTSSAESNKKTDKRPWWPTFYSIVVGIFTAILSFANTLSASIPIYVIWLAVALIVPWIVMSVQHLFAPRLARLLRRIAKSAKVRAEKKGHLAQPLHEASKMLEQTAKRIESQPVQKPLLITMAIVLVVLVLGSFLMMGLGLLIPAPLLVNMFTWLAGTGIGLLAPLLAFAISATASIGLFASVLYSRKIRTWIFLVLQLLVVLFMAQWQFTIAQTAEQQEQVQEQIQEDREQLDDVCASHGDAFVVEC